MGPMILQPAARYPADPRVIFILVLSVFSGFTALALEAGPQSLEALLPRWGVLLWGVLLLMGSLVTLVGLLVNSINGIVAEQIGSVMISATTIFYSALAMKFVGVDALQVVGPILGWGLACAFRWFQLQKLINTTYKRKLQKQAVNDVLDEIADSEKKQ